MADKKLHVQPTNEELEAGIAEAIEEVEKPEEVALENEPETPPEEETADEVEETPVEEQPDYKKKFVESSRESQILHAQNKKTNEILEEAMAMPDPDEAELKTEYPDWDELSVFEQKMARETLTNKRRMAKLSELAESNKNVAEWLDKVDKFAENPKSLTDFPDLEGKMEEFKLFCVKPTRRGVDFEDLVSAFLYERPKPVANKGKMFEKGSAGLNDKPKVESGKITQEQAEVLRKTDYPKFVKYLTEGKIEPVES